MHSNSKEHRSAFNNPYLSADGREDNYDNAIGEWDNAEGNSVGVGKLAQFISATNGMSDNQKSLLRALGFTEQTVQLVKAHGQPDGSISPFTSDELAGLTTIQQALYNQWLANPDFYLQQSKKGIADNYGKRPEYGSDGIKRFLSFMGDAEGYLSKAELKKLSQKQKKKYKQWVKKKKAAHYSADGTSYSIMLNDNGECI